MLVKNRFNEGAPAGGVADAVINEDDDADDLPLAVAWKVEKRAVRE